MKLLKRYIFLIITIAITAVIWLINRDIGTKAIDTTIFSLKEMLLILPPIFVLLGLLDVWVPRETMIKYLGEGSGLRGILISIFIGSVAAGPLYGAFPVALVLMKKGARYSNVLLFIGAWSTTKIPMILFEISSLGLKFALTRLAVSLIGIFSISYVVNKIMSRKETDALYQQASKSK